MDCWSTESTAQVHPRLTFDEVNIVWFNIKKIQTQGEFLVRLDNLLRNTTDPYLTAALCSLQEKIRKLSPREFRQLQEDCMDPEKDANAKIMFPQDYALPTLGPKD